MATSSRKSSTSPTWASKITMVAGACSPSAAETSADAEPQAPSIVALRPFLSAATTSGNPGARWISRVRSLSSRSAAVLFVDRLELLGIVPGRWVLTTSH